jgi:hypothetical protein
MENQEKSPEPIVTNNITNVEMVDSIIYETSEEPEGVQKTIIDKLAEYVSRNGREFEATVAKKNDERFDFINKGHKYHKYYCLQIEKATEIAKKEEEQEKLEVKVEREVEKVNDSEKRENKDRKRTKSDEDESEKSSSSESKSDEEDREKRRKKKKKEKKSHKKSHHKKSKKSKEKKKHHKSRDRHK